jgi:hypothetical protein
MPAARYSPDMAPKPRQLTMLGRMPDPENYRELAAQEAALAKAAITNDLRARHYAMAAYYTRLAEAKEKWARASQAMAAYQNDP